MLYKLYLDESNTSGPAPDLIMAGFLGSAREWQLLLRRLHVLQRDYGFKTFHATEFKNRSGQFRGWSEEKCSELVGALARAVRDHLTEGLNITLPHRQFVEEYSSIPPEKGELQLSQFGLCVETCIARAYEIVRELGGTHRLDVIVEAGHKNSGSARTVFEAMKKDFEAQGSSILGSVSIVTKSHSEALMFADFQAYATLLSDRRERVGLPGYNNMTRAAPRKRNAGLTTIHFEPGTLKIAKARRAAIARNKRLPRLKSDAATMAE
jgi:hypothetical protein